MKQFLLLVCMFLFLAGCKKNNEPFKGYFTLTIDGKKEDYSGSMRANSFNSGTSLEFSGKANLTELNVHFTNPTIGRTPVTGTFYSLRFTLLDILNQEYYYAGDGGISSSAEGSGEINITELDADFIKGTFNFITAKNLYTLSVKTVTDGEFYIKRDR